MKLLSVSRKEKRGKRKNILYIYYILFYANRLDSTGLAVAQHLSRTLLKCINHEVGELGRKRTTKGVVERIDEQVLDVQPHLRRVVTGSGGRRNLPARFEQLEEPTPATTAAAAVTAAAGIGLNRHNLAAGSSSSSSSSRSDSGATAADATAKRLVEGPPANAQIGLDGRVGGGAAGGDTRVQAVGQVEAVRVDVGH